MRKTTIFINLNYLLVLKMANLERTIQTSPISKFLEQGQEYLERMRRLLGDNQLTEVLANLQCLEVHLNAARTVAFYFPQGEANFAGFVETLSPNIDTIRTQLSEAQSGKTESSEIYQRIAEQIATLQGTINGYKVGIVPQHTTPHSGGSIESASSIESIATPPPYTAHGKGEVGRATTTQPDNKPMTEEQKRARRSPSQPHSGGGGKEKFPGGIGAAVLELWKGDPNALYSMDFIKEGVQNKAPYTPSSIQLKVYKLVRGGKLNKDSQNNYSLPKAQS